MEAMSPLIQEALELRSESSRKRKRRALLRAAVAQVEILWNFSSIDFFFLLKFDLPRLNAGSRANGIDCRAMVQHDCRETH